jgi:transglutaminase-like putative cysteine protease
MRQRIIFLAILFASVFSLNAKDRPELAALLIPESLTKGANSVVRDAQTQFIYTDKTKGTEVQHQVITVLNEKGWRQAHFRVAGDQYRKLKQFSAVVYNASGKEIKQYKKSDVATSQWSQNLTSDDLNYLWDCPAQSYPFTIVYDYEMEWKNGFFTFPSFAPQEDNSQTVQQASYTLQVPATTEILIEGNKFIPAPTKNDVQNITTYKWELKDIPTVEQEPLSPSDDELLPLLYTAPKQFFYDGYEGSFESTMSIGNFLNKLNEGRSILTDATKQKIIELTKNAKNDKEKVKILYDYLGQSTRYESIQLGIGGWQPIRAADVCKNGFGDCKGLSFYLKSMLEAIGIPSNYTVIRMDEDNKKLKDNFTAFMNTNHVILQVPLPKDTLWLECTAANRVPFGFVHNNIAGHNAIVITPNGGVMQKLPDYPDSTNISSKNIQIKFRKDAPTEISLKCDYRLKEYDDLMDLQSAKPNEQVDFVRQTIQIPNANVSQLTLLEEKSATPFFSLNYKVTASPFGTSTGSRYFLPLNAFRKNDFKLRKNKRVNDIVVNNGWKESDNIEIELPENTEVEYLPSSISFKSSFGDFQSSIKQEGKTIQVSQQLLFHNGRWTPDKYKEFIDFLDKVSAVYNDAIVVKGN